MLDEFAFYDVHKRDHSEKLLRQFPLRRVLSLLDTVNCNRHKVYEIFEEHYFIHRDRSNLVYCIFGCPTQCPESFVKRIIYEHFRYNDIKHDDEYHAWYYGERDQPAFHRFPLGFTKEDTWSRFTESFKKSFKIGNFIDIYNYFYGYRNIVFLFNIKETDWHDRINLHEHIYYVVQKISFLAPSSLPRFIFFFVFNFYDMHSYPNEEINLNIKTLEELLEKSTQIDPSTQFLLLPTLQPVHENDVEKWIKEFIGYKYVAPVKAALQSAMTNEQRKIYANEKYYDMEMIEKMQYAAYVISKALSDAITTAKSRGM